MKVNFIAEVSSNHSRDLARSLEFVDVAAEAGCDSVKFQLFKILYIYNDILHTHCYKKIYYLFLYSNLNILCLYF